MNEFWHISIISIIVALGVLIWRGARWTGKIDTSIEGLRSDINQIKNDIKKIFERLPSPKTANSGSPLQLTSFGKKISKEVGACLWAADHANELIDEARGKEEYEIFALCVNYVENKFGNDKELTHTVNVAAYGNGTETEQVLMVYRIELRDCILARLRESS